MKSVKLQIPALALAGLLAGPALVEAQNAPQLTREAAVDEGFGLINSVREMADGRVLIADPLSRTLQLVDLSSGSIELVGSEGQGPEEYRQPDAVYALPDGRSLLVDLGNARLTELGADLSFGRTHPLAAGTPGQDFEPRIPGGVDDQGRVYYQSMSFGPGMGLPTHATVKRWDLGSGEVESLGEVKLAEREERTSGGPNNQNRSIRQIPLSAADGWAVGPGGDLALVRTGEAYRVDWVRGDGTSVEGPPQTYDPVRIRGAEREEWLATRAQRGGGIGISMEVDNSQVRTSFARGGRGPEQDDYAWPDHKPAFDDDDILVDAAGRAWVRLNRPAGEAPMYEVFDSRGRSLGEVELEPNRRVIGFGEGTAYVVRFDDMDLQYLERYRIS